MNWFMFGMYIVVVLLCVLDIALSLYVFHLRKRSDDLRKRLDRGWPSGATLRPLKHPNRTCSDAAPEAKMDTVTSCNHPLNLATDVQPLKRPNRNRPLTPSNDELREAAKRFPPPQEWYDGEEEDLFTKQKG